MLFLSTVFSLYWLYSQVCRHTYADVFEFLRVWKFIILDVWIFTCPFLLFKRRWLVLVPLAVLVVILLGILWYFRCFGTLLPLQSLFMVENFAIALPSVLPLIHLSDFLILLPIISCVFFFCFSHRLISGTTSGKFRAIILALLICAIVVDVFGPASLARRGYWMFKRCVGVDTRETPLDISFRGLTDDVHFLLNGEKLPIKCSGIFRYIVFNVNQILFARYVNSERLEQVHEFINEKNECVVQNPPVTHDSTQKNLILIIVESLSSNPIGKQVGGIEITPVLNHLIKKTSTFYVPKILTQINSGVSGDGYLLLNTGLLPLKHGVASKYPDNTFCSLAGYLGPRGYTSSIFTGTAKEIWDLHLMSKSCGFDTLLDRKYLGVDGVCPDEQLFNSSVSEMRKMQKPFIVELLTSSMHSPYSKEWIQVDYSPDDFEEKEEYFYCNVVSYTDHCLGRFLEDLKSAGLYDNSMIVITADHTNPLYLTKDLSDQFIPLIVLNCPEDPGRIEQVEKANLVYGQVDIFPTLLHVMGLEDVPFTGLGTAIFENVDDCAASRTGEVIGGNQTTEMIKRKRDLWDISDTIIRADYFRDHPLTLDVKQEVADVKQKVVQEK